MKFVCDVVTFSGISKVRTQPISLSLAEEVPQEGQTDSRFSIKCRWYRSVITKSGQVISKTNAAFLVNSVLLWIHFVSPGGNHSMQFAFHSGRSYFFFLCRSAGYIQIVMLPFSVFSA